MHVNLIIESALWAEQSLDFEAILKAVANYLSMDESREVAVVLTDDARICELNRAYRGQNKPTNVLSFPSDTPDEWGDVILAHETIAGEAAAQGKRFSDHLTHLLVHGMLHLMGYDHEEDAEAEAMEALEIVILKQLGIANPYQ